MAGPVTNLRSLVKVNFRTSKRADEVTDRMQSKLGLRFRYEPARLAIATSLALPEPAPPLRDEDADDYGKVIHGDNLFGDDDFPLWIAMIVEKADLRNPTLEDIQEQVRRHWHRGILQLQTEWENCEGVYERFILYLAERAGLHAQGEQPQGIRKRDGRRAVRAKPECRWHCGLVTRVRICPPGSR